MSGNRNKTISLRRQVTGVFMVMIVFMTMYEMVKQVLFPDISLWESHVITIIFTSVLAAAVSFFTLDRLHREYFLRVRETEMRKKNEEALQERERRWIGLINNAIVGIYQCRPNGDFLLVNDKFAHMFGYASQEEFLLSVSNISVLYKTDSERKRLVRILEKEGTLERALVNFVTRNGEDRWCGINAVLANPNSEAATIEGFVVDITELKALQDAREELVGKLQESLAQIKVLKGMLPICASCKKIRDDKGYWNQIESYIQKHSDAEFSHSLCPECAKMLYPEIDFESNR